MASRSSNNQGRMITSAELEALALQCRDASFRESLEGSPLWDQVATTLQACCEELGQQISRSASNISQDHPKSSTAVEDEDDGLSYSFSVRKDAVIDGISPDAVTVHVRDATVTSQLIEQATSAFRFLRNACARSPWNQDACREHRVLHTAHAIIVGCCSWIDVEDDRLQKSTVLLAQVALQFCVNAVTGHVENQQVVWSLFFPDHLQKILVECHAHRKIVAFTAALMLNCVNKTLDDDRVSHRHTDLVESRNLVITLLQRCLTKPVATSSPSPASVEIDDHDPAFEWLCLLFKVLFEAGYSKHLYNAVGAHMLSKLWSRVTPEQLILLRMFTMWMTTHRSAQQSVGQPTKVLPVDDEAAYQTIFEFVTNTWVYVVSRESEDRPEEADETRKIMWTEFENEAKLLLLEVMGELSLKRIANTTMAELMDKLLRSLLEELQVVWQQRRLGAKPPLRTSQETPTREQLGLPPTEPFGYRSAIIRVCGNLTYRHTEHQDLVRDEGFLPLFLNHCNIDEANPLLREWSLVALRNLCEDNVANQEFINTLRPQGIDRSSIDLDSINVDASLDEGGKLRVSRK